MRFRERLTLRMLWAPVEDAGAGSAPSGILAEPAGEAGTGGEGDGGAEGSEGTAGAEGDAGEGDGAGSGDAGDGEGAEGAEAPAADDGQGGKVVPLGAHIAERKKLQERLDALEKQSAERIAQLEARLGETDGRVKTLLPPDKDPLDATVEGLEDGDPEAAEGTPAREAAQLKADAKILAPVLKRLQPALLGQHNRVQAAVVQHLDQMSGALNAALEALTAIAQADPKLAEKLPDAFRHLDKVREHQQTEGKRTKRYVPFAASLQAIQQQLAADAAKVKQAADAAAQQAEARTAATMTQRRTASGASGGGNARPAPRGGNPTPTTLSPAEIDRVDRDFLIR